MQGKKRALEKAGGRDGGEGVGSWRFMALWRQLFCPASCPGAVGWSGGTRLEAAPRQEPDPAGTQWGHRSCQIPRTSKGHWSYTHLSKHGCLAWDHHTAWGFWGSAFFNSMWKRFFDTSLCWSTAACPCSTRGAHGRPESCPAIQ